MAVEVDWVEEIVLEEEEEAAVELFGRDDRGVFCACKLASL